MSIFSGITKAVKDQVIDPFDIFGGRAGAEAAKQQAKYAQYGIDEQRRQFDIMQGNLNPYMQAATGTAAVLDADGNVVTPAQQGSFGQQQALLGLQGQDAYNQALQPIMPQYNEMAMQGENAMLQNASATGGLRGGNTQAALAQFRPQLLQSLIDQQYSRLGGITGSGQNAAAGLGTAGMGMASNIGNLYGQKGQAVAGGILAPSQAYQNMIGTGLSALGAYTGAGGRF